MKSLPSVSIHDNANGSQVLTYLRISWGDFHDGTNYMPGSRIVLEVSSDKTKGRSKLDKRSRRRDEHASRMNQVWEIGQQYHSFGVQARSVSGAGPEGW